MFTLVTQVPTLEPYSLCKQSNGFCSEIRLCNGLQAHELLSRAFSFLLEAKLGAFPCASSMNDNNKKFKKNVCKGPPYFLHWPIQCIL